jgi:hypothetical protein
MRLLEYAPRVKMARCQFLLFVSVVGAGGISAAGAPKVNPQKALVLWYFAHNEASDKCGPIDLEAVTSATFFPSKTEMYIWNAGALSYYQWRGQKAVRLWTATPIPGNAQYADPTRRVTQKNTFIEWFKRAHHFQELDVANECGTLPNESRKGPFYEVVFRRASQGVLKNDGNVLNRRQTAKNLTNPKFSLYER